MTHFEKVISNYETARELTEKMEKAFENDPMNAKLEEEWDAAYKAEYTAMMELVKEIVKMTNGAIEEKTARTMIITKLDAIKAIAAIA